MSATGLLPWYAGRRIGLEGRGVRSVYLDELMNYVKRQLCANGRLNSRDGGITFHAVE